MPSSHVYQSRRNKTWRKAHGHFVVPSWNYLNEDFPLNLAYPVNDERLWVTLLLSNWVLGVVYHAAPHKEDKGIASAMLFPNLTIFSFVATDTVFWGHDENYWKKGCQDSISLLNYSNVFSIRQESEVFKELLVTISQLLMTPQWQCWMHVAHLHPNCGPKEALHLLHSVISIYKGKNVGMER